MDVFGHTRSRVARDHALIDPGSFVTTALTGWERTQGVILIAPRMGARFTQYLTMMDAGGSASPAPAGIERCVFVLEGSLTIQAPGAGQRTIDAGGFAFLPADDRTVLRA